MSTDPADAYHLVNDLAAVAGYPDRVRDTFEALITEHGPHAAVALALHALEITYAECMTAPAPTDPPSPVHVRITNTRS